MADEGEGTGGTGAGQPPATPPPVQPPEQRSSFSQADLDKIAGEARESGRKTAEKALLDQLGVSDLDSAKQALAEAKTRADAEKSELQRATEERDRFQAEAAEARAEASQVRLDTALERALRDGGLKPERLAAAMRLVDRGVLEVADGEVKGLSVAVEALKSESPEWFGGPPRAPDATGGDGNGETDYRRASPEELAKGLARFGVKLRT